MGGERVELYAAEAASALAWWLDAGVDVAVQETPRDWLAPAATPQPGRGSEPASPSNLVQPSQETLAELRDFLASSLHLPLAPGSAKRVLPHGPENAPVMLLSEAPSLEDAVAGQPIGGPAWELAERMLAAIGIDAADAYSASLSCFHAPGSRLSGEDLAACADLARRHVALARPQRLILFGDAPSLALLGKPVAAARGHVHKVEGVRTIVTFHPRFLLNQPSNKRLAWEDLLLLMEDQA